MTDGTPAASDARPLSRRTVLGRMARAVVAVAAFAGTRRAAAQQKASKEEAKYQDHPKGQQRCEICVNFQPPGQCRFVAGAISQTGWCQFFAAKENAH
ncbi:MAG: high potential iron sulfur protein [Alphaproteobacteria bacterium]